MGHPTPPTPSPSPSPSPRTPSPTPPTPSPAPPSSVHGIKNHGSDPPVCLQAEKTSPSNGQSVTVAACDGSEKQDWKFDSGSNAITYKDFCMDASSMTSGENLIIWECNGM